MAQPEARNRASVIVSIIFIGLGVLVLLGEFLHVGAGTFWPLFIIVPGLLFFLGMVFGGRSAGPLAIPGSIVTMVGLILQVQAWTDHFESWVYAWALIVVAVGIGMIIHGMWSGDERAARSGRRVLAIGAIIFLVLGAFFELIFNLSKSGLAGYVWPVLMIGVGVYLLARRGVGLPGSGDGARHPVEAAPAQPKPPAPPKPAAPAAETQFEPLDMTRGRRGSRKAKSETTDK